MPDLGFFGREEPSTGKKREDLQKQVTTLWITLEEKEDAAYAAANE